MTATAQRQLPLDTTGAAQLAQQAELHPELNRAHVRFINLGKTYHGKQRAVEA
ncbi:ABC transporter, partial [Pseudomonas syringae pv. actinidiae ICMP 19079]